MVRSNQGHAMMVHTYNPYLMSIPSINFLHRQGQRSNQGHIMTLHTPHPLTNVPNKFQLLTPYGFSDTGQTNFFPLPTQLLAHLDTMGENNTKHIKF